MLKLRSDHPADDAAFLRSINVRLDALSPDRIAHFQPTSKSVALLRPLLGLGTERSLLVVAPYGTGKSLAATYALQLVENRPEARSVLRAIQERLARVSPELAASSANRYRSRQQGLVVTLNGHVVSLGVALLDAAQASARRIGNRTLDRRLTKLLDNATNESGPTVIRQIHALAADEGLDRLVLLWDEFGRHLESLVSTGHTESLNDVQTIAEMASRLNGPRVSVCLLLHRGLMHYAASLPQSVVSEWKKVEGRFETVQYVDDSKEVYRLVAEVCASRSHLRKPPRRVFANAARRALAAGIFRDYRAGELRDLLELAYPLEPTTLFLLPRLAARVAQNERTLFGFLYAQPMREPIGPAALYDYFSAAMQADAGPGGTFKQWLETQSAISKALDVAEGASVLRTACLLGLGASGDRARTTPELLHFAVSGFGDRGDSAGSIAILAERKLLLQRRHSNEVSVWHGTDLDLRGRLEDEKRRHRPDFELSRFLATEAPAPSWRPTTYNDQFGVRRYFAGSYRSIAALEVLTKSSVHESLGGAPDGWVLYVLAESEQESRRAEELLRNAALSDRVLAAIPSRPVAITEIALELFSLLRMSLDADLVASDPLVGSELQQMIDDARSHLQRQLERLTVPGDEARWFYGGTECVLRSTSELRRKLSMVSRQVFSLTPRFLNELIVKKKPSAVIVNSRKKLLMGILERSGTADLGIRGQFPDASMLRTILLKPGLYRADSSGGFRYARPAEISDRGLREVWSILEGFFTEAEEEPKSVSALLNLLVAPPYGVREGLLPILFAAGLKAFAASAALRRDGQYVQDILPSEIELVCREPERFTVVVVSLNKARRLYLSEILSVFGVAGLRAQGSAETLRLAAETLQSWGRQLPPGAWTTHAVSPASLVLREAIQQEADPVALFFRRIPRACGFSPDDAPAALVDALRAFKFELEQVLVSYRVSGEATIRRTMDITEAPCDLRAVVTSWASCFDEHLLDRGLDGIARGLLQRAASPYQTDEALLDSIANLLVGKSLGRWDDASLIAFQRELASVVRRVEDTAANVYAEAQLDPVAAERLSHLLAGRIRGLFTTYAHLAGFKEASSLAGQLLGEDVRKGRRSGNDR